MIESHNTCFFNLKINIAKFKVQDYTGPSQYKLAHGVHFLLAPHTQRGAPVGKQREYR